MTKQNLILHPIFIGSLLTLLLNDFYLKQTFSNHLTGKLSDFAGLIIFPIFIAYLIPKFKKWASIAAGILFVIWKTPIVSPLIDILNQTLPFRIQRIIDYSDYWALFILALTHNIIKQDTKINLRNNFILRVSKIGLTVFSLFAICATSYIRPPEIPKGTIYIGKEYTIKKSKEETIQILKSLGHNVDYHENSEDSTTVKQYYSRKVPYYQTDNIVIYDDDSKPIDTISNVKYTLYEPKENQTNIEIINVTLSEDGNIQKWQTLKYLRKRYKKILEKQMIKKIK